MRLLTKTAGALALSFALSGCLGGLLGGGGKPPTTLVTLTPEAAEPGQIARTAGAGQAVKGTAVRPWTGPAGDAGLGWAEDGVAPSYHEG